MCVSICMNPQSKIKSVPIIHQPVVSTSLVDGMTIGSVGVAVVVVDVVVFVSLPRVRTRTDHTLSIRVLHVGSIYTYDM